MKKVLSLLTAIIIFSTSLGVCFSASAAEGCVSLTLSCTVYGDTVRETLDLINAERAAAGMDAISPDAELTAKAEQRAAEIMMCADSIGDKRPDGSDITSIIPDYGISSDTAFGILTDAATATLKTTLNSFSTTSYAKIKSVGIAVAEYSGTTAYYAIISVNDAKSAPAFSTRTQNFDVNIAVSSFTRSGIVFDLSKNKRYYSLSTRFYADGLYREYVTIPNEQIAYKSSKVSVFKIKNYKGYVKKNGKFTISASLNDGTFIISYDESTSGYNKVNPTLSSVKSTKKKTFKATWTKNIVDADGYQIQYSTNKKFKKSNKTVIVKGQKKATKTVKKLKSKKIYYVRVRAYIDQGNNEKAYSNWSKTVKVKVK